jgi:2-(1,2-epoxy-1,2-dihydrophenyl)acetyl-CoA isomerase
MEQYIITDIKDNIAYITLNRPEKFNSFIRPMALALQNFVKEQANNTNVRCFYLTGNGKAFCAGQDLAEAIDPNGPELTKIVEEHYNPIVQLIRETEKPFIAAVNGVAAGAGANIALACDIVVATESASFIQAFSKIGLIPDSGGTYILPRLIGWQKASALMMTGDKVSAEEAEKMGMIYKYFKDDEFENEAKKLAEKIANMPTKGLGLTKKLLNKSFTSSLNEQLDLENEYQTIAGQTYDYEEGVKAFLEKRKPEFLGK